MSTKKHYLEKELYDLLKNDSSAFQFLQDKCCDGMWYWDLEKPENEWMSDRFWKNFGYDPATKKHLVSEWQDIINQDDLEIALNNFRKHCEDSTHPYDQIVRYTREDGATSWVRCRGFVIRNEQGKPIRLLGTHFDITETKELKEREQVLTALQAIDDVVFVLNKDEVFDNCVVNNTSSSTFLPRKEFIGLHYSEVWPKHISKRFKTALKKIVVHKSVQSFDYMLLFEGKEKWFEVRITGKYNEDSLTGFVFVIRDISARKASEKILRDHCSAVDDFKEAVVEREETIYELRSHISNLECTSSDTSGGIK